MINKIRIKRMESLYKTGQTLQEIGDQFGLTRERIRQILKTRNIARKDRKTFPINVFFPGHIQLRKAVELLKTGTPACTFYRHGYKLMRHRSFLFLSLADFNRLKRTIKYVCDYCGNALAQPSIKRKWNYCHHCITTRILQLPGLGKQHKKSVENWRKRVMQDPEKHALLLAKQRIITKRWLQRKRSLLKI